jgi:hypothetical protein
MPFRRLRRRRSALAWTDGTDCQRAQTLFAQFPDVRLQAFSHAGRFVRSGKLRFGSFLSAFIRVHQRPIWVLVFALDRKKSGRR